MTPPRAATDRRLCTGRELTITVADDAEPATGTRVARLAVGHSPLAATRPAETIAGALIADLLPFVGHGHRSRSIGHGYSPNVKIQRFSGTGLVGGILLGTPLVVRGASTL